MNFMCRGEKKKCDLDLPRVSACGKVKDSAPDYGAQRLQTQRFYPQRLKRGEKTVEKKVDMVHPVAQEVSPRLQFGLKDVGRFWDAARRRQE